MIKKIIFYTPLILIFLFEGLGFEKGRQISLYLIYLWPILLYFYSFFKKEKINFPKQITTLILLFLFFSFLSVIFSVDKEQSLAFFSYYLSLFVVFIYVNNHQELFEKNFISFTLFISTIFLIISTLINHISYFSFLIPTRGYQYIYPLYKTHNPISSLLMISIIILTTLLIKKTNGIYWIFYFVFIFFLLLSYSRSAMIATVITLFVFILIKKTYRKGIFFLVFILLMMIIVTQYSQQVKLLGTINQKLTKIFAKDINLDSKSFFGSREKYFIQAIEGIKEKPLFGFGPGNYYYVSQKYQKGEENTVETADNILFEMFAENGLLAGLVYLFFIFFIIKNSRKNILFFVFLAMLILFQTDSSQRYYSYLLYFFIIAGLIYKESKTVRVNSGFLLIVFGIIFFTFCISAFDLFENKIFQSDLLRLKLYPVDNELLVNIGQKNKEKKDFKKTIEYFSQALNNYPKKYFYLIGEMYGLESRLYGKTSADQKMAERLKKYYQQYHFYLDEKIKGMVSTWCFYDLHKICHLAGIRKPVMFSQPEANEKIEVNSWIPYRAEYSINDDGLNDLLNYSIKKENKVFRIIALGESNTFGLHVNTKDNWTEILEDKLNKNQKCDNTKKFEVINLGMHGYDIEYIVHRYKLKGVKYQPDLILWLFRNLNFYQLNELMLPKLNSYNDDLKENGEFNRQINIGNFHPSFRLAYQEVISEMGLTNILKKQEEFFDDFGKIYQGETIFFTQGEINKNIMDFLIKQKEKLEKTSIKFNNNLNARQYYFLGTGSLTPEGQRLLADTIYEYLINTSAIECAK